MINIPDDIPKYKKKSTRHPPKKSKHKHTYEDCLLKIKIVLKYNTGERIVDRLHLGNYCTICGKIGNTQAFESEYEPETGYYRILSREEVLKKHKDLEIFVVESIFDKYVVLSKDVEI